MKLTEQLKKENRYLYTTPNDLIEIPSFVTPSTLLNHLYKIKDFTIDLTASQSNNAFRRLQNTNENTKMYLTPLHDTYTNLELYKIHYSGSMVKKNLGLYHKSKKEWLDPYTY